MRSDVCVSCPTSTEPVSTVIAIEASQPVSATPSGRRFVYECEEKPDDARDGPKPYQSGNTPSDTPDNPADNDALWPSICLASQGATPHQQN